MRTLIGGLIVVFIGGCSTCGSSPYWKLEMGRAPTINVPALVSPQNGSYAVNPLAAYPASPPAGPTLPLRLAGPQEYLESPGPTLPYPRRFGAAPVDPCSCEALLKRLDGLERRLDSLNAPKRME